MALILFAKLLVLESLCYPRQWPRKYDYLGPFEGGFFERSILPE
jgi:hypothetical protein